MADGFFDYLTGHAQANAARKASRLQAAAGEKAGQGLTEQFQYGKGLLDPIARQAQGAYADLGGRVSSGQFDMPSFSFDPNNITQNPGYQFQLQQGQRALNQNASAHGNVLGGAQQRQLQGFGQGLANTYQNTFYNQALGTQKQNQEQKQQQYERYHQLIAQGMPATMAAAQLAKEYGQDYGQNLLGISTAKGQGILGASDAFAKQLGYFVPQPKDVASIVGSFMSGGGDKAAAPAAKAA
jgi:uncharacterized protein YoaH (UPF0181 family)